MTNDETPSLQAAEHVLATALAVSARHRNSDGDTAVGPTANVLIFALLALERRSDKRGPTLETFIMQQRSRISDDQAKEIVANAWQVSRQDSSQGEVALLYLHASAFGEALHRAL